MKVFKLIAVVVLAATFSAGLLRAQAPVDDATTNLFGFVVHNITNTLPVIPDVSSSGIIVLKSRFRVLAGVLQVTNAPTSTNAIIGTSVVNFGTADGWITDTDFPLRRGSSVIWGYGTNSTVGVTNIYWIQGKQGIVGGFPAGGPGH